MIFKRVFAGILVAFFFAAALASSSGPLLFAILLSLSSMALYEFYALALGSGYRVYTTFGIFCGICWLLCEYFFLPPFASGAPRISPFPLWSPIALFAIFFAIMLRTMFDERADKAIESGAITFLGVLYLPVTLSYYIRIAQWEISAGHGATRAAVFLAFFLTLVIKMSDTGAFAVGTFMRNRRKVHPLFPRISPNKTWEGLAGGAATGILIGLGLTVLARKFEWGPAGIFWAHGAAPLMSLRFAVSVSAMLVAAGVFGDLIESMMKRASAVKDSASIIPGIGGLLDIVDSLVFGPAVMYFALELVS